jgi:tetratricopeptide (TPR) repeat protein
MWKKSIRLFGACSLLVLAPALSAADANLEALQKAGRWKALRNQVEAGLKANPNEGALLLWRSRVQEAFQQTEPAYATAKKATELAPQSPDAWAQLSSVSGQMAAKAGLLQKWGFAKECKAAGEKALALDPRNEAALQVMVQFHLQAPGMVGGDKAKAEVLGRTLATVDPDYTLSQELNAAFKTKDRARIDAAVAKAAAARPKEVWPLRAGANACLDATALRPQEAEAFARRIIALQPAQAEGYSLLVQAQAAAGKWKEVDETLALVEQRSAENLLPYYALGKALLLGNRELPRAEACFRRYLGQEPEGGAPDRAAAHWRLALVLEKEGKKADAVKQLETSVAIRPEFEEAKKDLKRLK